MIQRELPLPAESPLRSINKEAVLKALHEKHVGEIFGVSGRTLARELCGIDGSLAAERRLRTVVTELRLLGHPICGTPESGYFMARTPEELNHTLNFLYERGMTAIRQIARMQAVAEPDLRGQLQLPT